MKTRFLMGYLAVFTAAVITGYFIGHKLSEPNAAPPALQAMPGGLSYASDQINFLVFHVSQLKTRPELRVVWLAAYKPDAGLMFVPVYPPVLPGFYDEQDFLKRFALRYEGKRWTPGDKILNMLHEQGITWHGTILLDDHAVELLTGLNLNNEAGGKSLLKSSQTAANVVTAPYSWKKIWQAVCWNAMKSPQNFSSLGDDFMKHYAIEAISAEILEKWQTIFTEGNLPSCEFPASSSQTH